MNKNKNYSFRSKHSKRMRNSKKSNSEFNNINSHKLSFFILLILILFFTILLVFQLTLYYSNIKNYSDTELPTSSTLDNLTDDNVSELITNSSNSDDLSIKDTSFTLSAIGDIMCHNTQYIDAYDSSTGNYDFDYVFENISYYLQTSDISIGNLETCFAGSEVGYSSYPTFNTPSSLANSLKDIGLDVLTTANNHSMDTGYLGLCSTIDVLDDVDISHTGTFQNEEDSNTILYKYVKDIKIAFLSYTYGTNGISIPSSNSYCVNLIDEDAILEDINKAKLGGADIIVSSIHWGTEYSTSSIASQEELADFLFKNGVDIILGSHPHVLEPMEKRLVTMEDGTIKECFVIYSLGNFISDQTATNTRTSIILNLDITVKNTGEISIDSANYIPIYMYDDKSSSKKSMKLLDIESIISEYDYNILSETTPSISSSLYSFLKEQLTFINKTVGEEF